jgi:hypothetical protein
MIRFMLDLLSFVPFPWEERRIRRKLAAKAEEFRSLVRVPYSMYAEEDCAYVFVEHRHLQEVIDACKPASFLLQAKGVNDQCDLWSLTFRFGDCFGVRCSWLVAYAEPVGIPQGYRNADGGTWVRV